MIIMKKLFLNRKQWNTIFIMNDDNEWNFYIINEIFIYWMKIMNELFFFRHQRVSETERVRLQRRLPQPSRQSHLSVPWGIPGQSIRRSKFKFFKSKNIIFYRIFIFLTQVSNYYLLFASSTSYYCVRRR